MTINKARASRRFILHRTEDVTGVSGTGYVADGVLWPDGTVTVRWRGQYPTTADHSNFESVKFVHLHEGRTKIRWLDPICGTCGGDNLIYGATIPIEASSWHCHDCGTIGQPLFFDHEDTDNERIARGLEPAGKWKSFGPDSHAGPGTQEPIPTIRDPGKTGPGV